MGRAKEVLAFAGIDGRSTAGLVWPRHYCEIPMSLPLRKSAAEEGSTGVVAVRLAFFVLVLSNEVLRITLVVTMTICPTSHHTGSHAPCKDYVAQGSYNLAQSMSFRSPFWTTVFTSFSLVSQV